MDIKKRIETLKYFTLNELSIKQLDIIMVQIDERISSLDEDLRKIERSLGVFKSDVFDKQNLLPNKFSSPLRQVLTKSWDLNRIEKLYNRYVEEKQKVYNLINEKKLRKNQIDTFKSRIIYQIKEFSIYSLIIFVIGLMIYEYNNPGLNTKLLTQIFIADTLCCGIFLTNFFFELSKSPDRKWYWKVRWIDFITSIPLPPGNLIRAGRLVRIIRIFRIFRIIRFLKLLKIVKVFTKHFIGMEALVEVLDLKLMKKTIIWSLAVAIIGGSTIYYVEKDFAHFNNWFEGLWWGITTILTGEFADLHNPSTLIGSVTAT